MAKILTEEQKTDLDLVLAHEYRRCDQAFINFTDHMADLIGKNWSKKTALAAYDSYANFIHHLYEFYVGCFKRNKGSLESISFSELDELIQGEVEKLMGIRRWRIEQGVADASENYISYYEVAVPDSFAEDFRQSRNRVAHTDFRRSGANESLTLTMCYEKYHKYLLLLYEEPYELWHVKAESYDWNEIEQFGMVSGATHENEVSPSLVMRIRNLLFYKQIKLAIKSRRQNFS